MKIIIGVCIRELLVLDRYIEYPLCYLSIISKKAPTEKIVLLKD